MAETAASRKSISWMQAFDEKERKRERERDSDAINDQADNLGTMKMKASRDGEEARMVQEETKNQTG
jgi:hypothetical protein